MVTKVVAGKLRKFLRRWLVITTVTGSAQGLAGTEYTVSLQQASLAPNAGGQVAWAARLSTGNSREYSLFANEYLRTGEYPLFGAIYSLRFPILGRRSPIQSFAQLGLGASSAGPVAEILWNLTPFWLIRIDMATHFYAVSNRVIVWNYPFWIGVTVPF